MQYEVTHAQNKKDIGMLISNADNEEDAKDLFIQAFYPDEEPNQRELIRDTLVLKEVSKNEED
jgi:hypothetical protein